MSLRSMIVRLPLLCLLVIMLATAGRASAHAELVRSEPAAGATVATAPQQVTIEFSQLLDAAKSSITVFDAAGTTVSQGKTEVLSNNNKVMRVVLKPTLGPGVYRVQWSNLSVEDGEEESDSFTFTVGGAGGTGTTPSVSGHEGAPPTPQLPATGATTPTWQPAMLAGIALALITMGGTMRSGWRIFPARLLER